MQALRRTNSILIGKAVTLIGLIAALGAPRKFL
jgi:hypothetical protein